MPKAKRTSSTRGRALTQDGREIDTVSAIPRSRSAALAGSRATTTSAELEGMVHADSLRKLRRALAELFRCCMGKKNVSSKRERISYLVASDETRLTNSALYGLITSMQGQERFKIVEVLAVPAPRRT